LLNDQWIDGKEFNRLDFNKYHDKPQKSSQYEENLSEICNLESSKQNESSTSHSLQSEKNSRKKKHNKSNINQSNQNRTYRLNLIDNKFELLTSKGKTLQLVITTDDPSESDIEEIKCILNKAYEENFEDKKKYVEKKDTIRDNPICKSDNNILGIFGDNKMSNKYSKQDLASSNKILANNRKTVTKSANNFVSDSNLEICKVKPLRSENESTLTNNSKKTSSIEELVFR
jgi:hypothetical protein